MALPATTVNDPDRIPEVSVTVPKTSYRYVCSREELIEFIKTIPFKIQQDVFLVVSDINDA